MKGAAITRSGWGPGRTGRQSISHRWLVGCAGAFTWGHLVPSVSCEAGELTRGSTWWDAIGRILLTWGSSQNVWPDPGKSTETLFSIQDSQKEEEDRVKLGREGQAERRLQGTPRDMRQKTGKEESKEGENKSTGGCIIELASSVGKWNLIL